MVGDQLHRWWVEEYTAFFNPLPDCGGGGGDEDGAELRRAQRAFGTTGEEDEQEEQDLNSLTDTTCISEHGGRALLLRPED